MTNWIQSLFTGRLSRVEFAVRLACVCAILFALLLIAASDALVDMATSYFLDEQKQGLSFWSYVVFALPALYMLGATIRRFHDMNVKFVFPALLAFVILAGAVTDMANYTAAFGFLYLLFLCVWPGDLIPNRYGLNPILVRIDTYLAGLVNVSSAKKAPEQKKVPQSKAIFVNLPSKQLVEEQTRKVDFFAGIKRSLNTYLSTCHGRIDGVNYFLRSIIYALALIMVMLPAIFAVSGTDLKEGASLLDLARAHVGLALFTVPLFLFIYYRFITLVIQRLHDIGRTGYWAIFLLGIGYVAELHILFAVLASLANLLSILLIFLPGQKGINQYGKDPLVPIYLRQRAIIQAKIAEKYGEAEAAKIDGAEEKIAEPSKPAKKKSAAKKAPAKKKTVAKKPVKKKAPAKKSPAKKVAPKKAAAKPKKAAPKKTTAKKAPAKKATAKKPAAKKAAAKKPAAKKKTTTKKTTSKKKS